MSFAYVSKYSNARANIPSISQFYCCINNMLLFLLREVPVWWKWKFLFDSFFCHFTEISKCIYTAVARYKTPKMIIRIAFELSLDGDGKLTKMYVNDDDDNDDDNDKRHWMVLFGMSNTWWKKSMRVRSSKMLDTLI